MGKNFPDAFPDVLTGVFVNSLPISPNTWNLFLSKVVNFFSSRWVMLNLSFVPSFNFSAFFSCSNHHHHLHLFLLRHFQVSVSIDCWWWYDESDFSPFYSKFSCRYLYERRGSHLSPNCKVHMCLPIFFHYRSSATCKSLIRCRLLKLLF